MVLPSSVTERREDALEAKQMLAEILDSPANAAERHAHRTWLSIFPSSGLLQHLFACDRHQVNTEL